jgi:serine/threonine protein kinase
VSILISEWANAGDLLDYLKKNHDKFGLREWRVIIFKILSVLAIIQNKYPSFRHNDMKANNILLHKISKTPTEKSNKYRYKINGQKYVVPNIGYQIKLWDFDFACIPGYIDNTKVSAEWTDKINIKPIKNRYYDIHYFFNTLTRKGFFPEFWEGENVHPKIREFVLRIIPEHYRNGDKVSDRGRLLVDDEYLTPDEILKNDPLFKIMRID